MLADKKFDTFICYRGKSVDDGIGESIGAQVCKLLDTNPSRFGNVFFAPREEGYNFITDCADIIADVKKFIVILSPNFFTSMSGKSVDELNKEEATYCELKCALQNKDCYFYPVLVYGFDWKHVKNAVFDVFEGDAEFASLLQKKGFDGGATAVLDDRLVHRTVRKVIGNEFSQNYISFFDKAPTSTLASVDADKLLADSKRDLSGCLNAIFARKHLLSRANALTDLYEYNNTTDKSKYFLPSVFLHTFDKVAVDCALTAEQDAEFCYWPVDLMDGQESNPIISICAVCFGTLMLHNWVKTDAVQSAGSFGFKQRIKQVKGAIKSGINLLIMLRSPLKHTWPSLWTFGSKGVDGTVNQTTLSLSTLLSCGFLSKDGICEDEEISLDTLKNRYLYIEESINSLIKAKNSMEVDIGNISGWGYMAENESRVLLPTAFCFETLLKFNQCIKSLAELYTDDAEFTAKLRKKSREVREILDSVLGYFYKLQQPDGSFKRLTSDEESSVTHTAKLLNVLYAYIESGAAEDEEAEQMAGKALRYLEALPQWRTEKLEDFEVFERFDYYTVADDTNSRFFEQNSGEVYENSGLLLYVTALIKAVKRADSPEKRALYFDKVRSTLNAVINNEGTIREDAMVIVRGARKEYPKYPIYSLYFYRMTLADYYKLCAEEE